MIGQEGKDTLGDDSDVKVVKNTVFWSWTNWCTFLFLNVNHLSFES